MSYDVNIQDFLREKGLGPAHVATTSVLLTADGDIAWVIGVQIADWCKVSAQTASILSLSFEPHGT
jgi:hypothetical protein